MKELRQHKLVEKHHQKNEKVNDCCYCSLKLLYFMISSITLMLFNLFVQNFDKVRFLPDD